MQEKRRWLTHFPELSIRFYSGDYIAGPGARRLAPADGVVDSGSQGLVLLKAVIDDIAIAYDDPIVMIQPKIVRRYCGYRLSGRRPYTHYLAANLTE